MYFASDNTGPALPEVMEALAKANEGYVLGYGNDALSNAVTQKIQDIFEAPEAAVYLVPTGTAANALALACLAQPYETIFCAPMAHIQEDECGAPEFYSGAKLTLVGREDKIRPDDLEQEIQRCLDRGFQGVKPGCLSLSQVTEFGQVYTLPELQTLSELAHSRGLPVHLDGARFANAMVSLGCTPAEMSWKSGIDAVSFGGTKNGCLGVEAVILFDPAKAQAFEARRKRGGHLFSKHRYLAAQMQGYLSQDRWINAAKAANAKAAQLVAGLSKIDGITFDYPADANVIFCQLPNRVHDALQAAGAAYYTNGSKDGRVSVRLVCDWSLPEAEMERLIQIAASA